MRKELAVRRTWHRRLCRVPTTSKHLQEMPVGLVLFSTIYGDLSAGGHYLMWIVRL